MFLLTISDDVNQSFSFDADFYETTIYLKCPDGDCDVSRPPIIDVYVQGYEPILGIPLIKGVDLLYEYVANGCLPYDYGSIMVVDSQGVDVTCDRLVLGLSSLIYFNPAESIATSIDV